MRRALRLLAFAVAAAAVIDPALTWRRPAPLAVEVRMPPASHPEYDLAVALRGRLAAAADDVLIDSGAAPSAIVAFSGATIPEPPGVPVFVLRPPGAKELRIREIRAPRAAFGQQVEVAAVVKAVGLRGATSTIELHQAGAVVSSVTHTWAGDDDTFDARLAVAAPAAGVHPVSVVVRAPGVADARADTAVNVEDRRCRILFFEPRPSWSLTFVRRALEADPLFEVAAITRTSRGITATTAGAPVSLTAAALERYDVIVGGAPEGVTDAEWDALLRFVAVRGGRLVLVPDVPLPQRVRTRLALPALDEVLVEKPLSVSVGSLSMLATETLLAPGGEGSAVLGSVEQGSAARAAIVAVPYDEGGVILSGVLDGWRFRADPASQFELAWRALLADAAFAAPPPFAVEVTPAVARPGDDVLVTVTVRSTEFETAGRAAHVPPVRAYLVGGGGGREMIRLWPADGAGVFEGRLKAPSDGRFVVSAGAGERTAGAVLIVRDDTVHPARDDSATLAFLAEATGGRVTTSLEGLRDQLRALRPPVADARLRPMRSPWAAVMFAALLCGEWASRRRSGLR
ncbi:MAG TPA: hypothetical protein VM364_04110 [Vicinamibacterales bacterium]|nr:hypothetical protein [Vicinamibacterales bacterium]